MKKLYEAIYTKRLLFIADEEDKEKNTIAAAAMQKELESALERGILSSNIRHRIVRTVHDYPANLGSGLDIPYKVKLPEGWTEETYCYGVLEETGEAVTVREALKLNSDQKRPTNMYLTNPLRLMDFAALDIE